MAGGSWLSRPSCTSLAVLSQITCPGWLVQKDLSKLTCPGWPFQTHQSRLIYSGWPVHNHQSRLACSGWPLLAVLSWLSRRGPAVLPRLFCFSFLSSLPCFGRPGSLSCPGYLFPAVLRPDSIQCCPTFLLYSDHTVLSVLFLAVMFWLPRPICPVLNVCPDALSRLCYTGISCPALSILSWYSLGDPIMALLTIYSI